MADKCDRCLRLARALVELRNAEKDTAIAYDAYLGREAGGGEAYDVACGREQEAYAFLFQELDDLPKREEQGE